MDVVLIGVRQHSCRMMKAYIDYRAIDVEVQSYRRKMSRVRRTNKR